MAWFLAAGSTLAATIGVGVWLWRAWRARFDDPDAERRVRVLIIATLVCFALTLVLFVAGVLTRLNENQKVSPAQTIGRTTGALGSLAVGNVIRTTYPLRSTGPIARNASLVLVLTAAIDPATLRDGDAVKGEAVLVREKASALPVALTASISEDRRIIVLHPRVLLGDASHETRYEATIGSGLKTASGAPVASPPYQWEFTVGVAQDHEAPKIVATFPEQGSTQAKNAVVQVLFSKPIDPITLFDGAAISLTPASETYARFLSDDLMTLELKGSDSCGVNRCGAPMSCWAASTARTVTIAAGIADVAGSVMTRERTFSWKSSRELEGTTPAIVRVEPRRNASGVPPHAPIRATFSTLLSAQSLTADSVSVPADWIEGSVRRTGLTSTIELSHAPFAASVIPIEPSFGSGLTTVFQQCFEPCIGP